MSQEAGSSRFAKRVLTVYFADEREARMVKEAAKKRGKGQTEHMREVLLANARRILRAA